MIGGVLSRLKALLMRSPLSRKISGARRIYYNASHDRVIRDYYLYVVDLLVRAAKTSNLEADIVVGAYPYRGRKGRHSFRVDFQIEHTLVKHGGRGAEHAPEGVVPIPGSPGQHYLVRVQDLERLDKADAVIDYSRPNLINLQSSGLYPALTGKLHYVAPLVYPLDACMSGAGQRDLEIITLFGNPDEPRRKALLETLKRWNPVFQNIRGRFDDVRDIYRRTRILVNIRQTDHHDTLEELRVLPALLSGVVVVSEEVPLRNEVPYRDFILWAPLQDLPALVREVHDNYQQHHDRIFSGDELSRCLATMEEFNRGTVRQLLAQLEARRNT